MQTRRRLGSIIVLGILALAGIFLASALLPGDAVIIILLVLLFVSFGAVAYFSRGGA